jgi:hypothetical protein
VKEQPKAATPRQVSIPVAPETTDKQEVPKSQHTFVNHSESLCFKPELGRGAISAPFGHQDA